MIIYHTEGITMSTTKVAITIDQQILGQLDILIKEKRFPNRSRAIQEAIKDKLDKIKANRLEIECAKLNPREEQQLAEEDMDIALETWSGY